MALSWSSNWETLQILNSDTSISQNQPPPDPAMELLGYYDGGLDLANAFIDQNYTDLLPYFFSSPFDPLICLSPEFFLHQDFDNSYPSLKRHKCSDNLYSSDFIPGSFDGYLPNSSTVPEFSPELLISSPQYFNVPQVKYCSTNDEGTSSRCITAQSIAARQRRRKITEKTTELGKLIPGGNKMNTAEMLQAAFNYVKYLQAQVGILDSMPPIQQTRQKWFEHAQESKKAEEAEAEAEAQLLESPTIQEKLYLKEKCLVPKQFVTVLAKRRDLQSNPSISNHINRLFQSLF
ncbi:hypothetical protein F0562_008580 [Nyssa sinensis]|uniref:BHLH domain-containing protein n=1 Tax=Nyssa sinensis TaxID=561372 RepID=A0A5J5ADC8_9ASTE|nr:hypothetical protein F0562_008580 [Nyssa sinensis]